MIRWRSLQYVPAHVRQYVNSPHIADADAVILDLEDSVPAAEKAAARQAIAGALKTLAGHRGDVLVRINAGADQADDVRAAVRPGVAALVAPKCESVQALRALGEEIDRAEAAAGLPRDSVKIVVLIESAVGFLNMRELLSASPRIIAANLGNEDFATDVGMVADADTLAWPRQQLAVTAVACGVAPLGLIGPTTDFRDLEAFRRLAERSRRFGFVGSSCIHPSQIAVLNEVFSPSAAEIAWAEKVVAAAEAGQREGRGAVALEGRMVDAPIVARARGLLGSVNSSNRRNDQTSL